MEVTRKQLLAGGAALALAGCGGAKKPPAAKPEAGLDPRYRHFDAFLFAAHGKPVRDAIERHRRGLDAGAAAYLHEHEAELDAAVGAAAATFLGVEAAELAFTDSTTMGLGLVYSGLLGPGDEVLTTEHDHYATHESLRLSGANVRKVALYDDPASATPAETMERLRDAITPRTKVVAVTWVHSGTGVKLPLHELGDVEPLVVVDGVHALGVTEPRRHRRRADRRHAQVAGRPARHRADLDARVGSDPRRRSRASPSPTTPARASRPAAGTPSSTAGRSRRPSRLRRATRRSGSRRSPRGSRTA